MKLAVIRSRSDQIIRAPAMSNRQFLEAYAQPGRIGLVGGETPIEWAIRAIERHVDEAKSWSRWSHVFVFGEHRCDGHHWLIESDIHIARKHIRLGAQENRIAKYFDERTYRSLAVLDFGLTPVQATALLSEGLELVAGRIRYSLRELMGALIALRRPALRRRENILAREQSFYCSAFVQHLFAKIGIDLVPGVQDKNSTPEDIARTPVPHVTYLLERRSASKTVRRLQARWRRRVANRRKTGGD
ncbi:MAG: hypothetical protein KGS61_12850 [Verrucomicrobia bacterium]|nr:hypothetical protein [Verrucomicrobiota bacterium]